MASQISTLSIVPPGAFAVLGADASASLVLVAATTVCYPDGTSDVLPVGIPAQVVGGGTTFDRSGHVWVAFCQKGDGILRIQKESLLFLLAVDYAPLVRILPDQIVPYQPVPALLAATLLTGSWSGGALCAVGSGASGGARTGYFLTHSCSGGAST